MEPIKEAVGDLMRALEAKSKIPDAQNPEVFLPRIFSKKELKHVQFCYFRRGTIGLSVDSAAWLYALNLKKEGLLAMIRKNIPGAKDVRFRLGEIR